MLLTNLDTPSQQVINNNYYWLIILLLYIHTQVQEAISSCLVPLAISIKSEADTISKKLLDKVSSTHSHTHYY